MASYNHSAIEKKWRENWAQNPINVNDGKKPKYYCLDMFPYPSGNGLHAGQLKSYIQLCLALSQLAKQVKTASANPQQTENPKYAMRTWLLRLGFIGEEFKTARELYTKRLEGDTAFRNGRS